MFLNKSYSSLLILVLFVTVVTKISTTHASETSTATGGAYTASVDWPSNANSELPMGGVFYGNYMAGVGMQNAGIGIESSRRFRAERTGTLEYVRYLNRTLNQNNITSRCEKSGPGSVWCDCVDADLDAYTCGYTLGSSYHVGNGGTIVVELRTDTPEGLPSDTILGKTEPFVPMENASTPFPELEFTTPVSVQAGHSYHLVFTNLTPPTSCTDLANIDPSEAASCPRDQGAQGLDGSRYLSTPSTTGLRGPYLGEDSTANYYRRTERHDWRYYPTSVIWYSVGYTDGVAVGDSYSPIEAMRAAEHTIEGSDVARQKFTVMDATRRVDGLWLNFGHTDTADGRPMEVTLKDVSGATLATGSIAASSHCIETIIEDSVHLAHWCKDWGYTELSEPVSLLEGSLYTVEMRSGSDSGFILSAYEATTAFKNRNDWVNSVAERSTNGGSSWEGWTDSRAAERDLALLFTIKGMPRLLR